MTIMYLTREQVREVDRRAIEEYGMSGLVLMENAGRGCVDTLCHLGIGGPVAICCGPGNNGGDGFVIARHLELRGFAARVLLFYDPGAIQGDAAANLAILRHCDVPILEMCDTPIQQWEQELVDADWIVDALLGTGARGEPHPPLDDVIHRLNRKDARRLAVDLPSGLDCDTGQAADATFLADHTCTLVAAKSGFAAEAASRWLGQVHVLDIGVPKRLVAEAAG